MILQGLDSALELLEYFTKQRPSWGVRELARASGKHHAVVHRILVTFAERGLLQQNVESGKYALGLRLFELGVVVRESMYLTSIVRTSMEKLADETGETVFLCWLHGKQATCLDVIESDSPVKFSTSIGTRSPLHAASFTKVILAFQDDAFITEVISAGLERLTQCTVVDPIVLREQLVRIRSQSWSYSEEESALDTCGLAVPISEHGGKVKGSLCIAGPLSRNSNQRLMQFLPALNFAAQRIAQTMQ